MSPFAEAPTSRKPSRPHRFFERRAALAFVVCLLAGLSAVVWRALRQVDAAHVLARLEARAYGASLELQFSQVPVSADSFGTASRQSRGGITNAPPSVRFQDVMKRARLDELFLHGYDYCLFTVPSAHQMATTLAAHGRPSLQDAVQQPLRLQNLDCRLAVKPRAGWVDQTKASVEALGVLLLSGFIALALNLIESRRAVEAELAEATRRLTREASEHGQGLEAAKATKERIVSLQADLERSQLARQQAESKTAELQVRLDSSLCARDQASFAAQKELKEALQKKEETIAQIQSRLTAAAQAERDAALAGKLVQQQEDAIADLQVRLDAATRSTQERSETNAARLLKLERENADLKSRLVAAEKAQAQVAELSSPLQTAETRLQSSVEASPKPTDAASLGAASAPTKSPNPSPKRRKMRPSNQMDLFGAKASAIESAEESREPEVASTKDLEAVEAPAPAKRREPSTTVDAKLSVGQNPKREELKPQRPRKSESTLPPVDAADLRKAVNQILPLLADQDPGAKDCLRDNRTIFRSAFSADGYDEFEQLVKKGEFGLALEQLKKIARKV